MKDERLPAQRSTVIRRQAERRFPRLKGLSRSLRGREARGQIRPARGIARRAPDLCLEDRDSLLETPARLERESPAGAHGQTIGGEWARIAVTNHVLGAPHNL